MTRHRSPGQALRAPPGGCAISKIPGILGVGRAGWETHPAIPPAEPDGRISRIRLSRRAFTHLVGARVALGLWPARRASACRRGRWKSDAFFHPVFQGSHHSRRPDGGVCPGPARWQSWPLSDGFSLRRHSRRRRVRSPLLRSDVQRVILFRSVHRESLFLAPFARRSLPASSLVRGL